jgi:hypothetical protein
VSLFLLKTVNSKPEQRIGDPPPVLGLEPVMHRFRPLDQPLYLVFLILVLILAVPGGVLQLLISML